ncbi:MAG: TonB-dependent receptor, partial [Rhodothermia bacterium]|nr:TonB-dependent receptor [Rhodothermia bacterium]
WVNGAYRQGNDYSAGDDVTVPGDFTSGEARAKVSTTLRNDLEVTVAGGFQDQRDIDFPGRLLDADFFEAIDAAVNINKAYTEGTIRRLDAGVYVHRVEHGMDNDEKPTAEAGTFPNGNPRPPLIIRVDARMTNYGGRAAIDLAAGQLTDLTIGVDVYSASRDAERPLFAVTPGGPVVPPFYVSDEVWPDVTITDAGVFASVRQRASLATITATGRLDVVQAAAGRVSDAYLSTTGFDAKDLDQNEANLSGSLTASHPIGELLLVSAGVGSVVRTADALERYSDRFPASKSQTSAEFIGNPTLKPERSTQVDLWIEGGSPSWAFSVTGFARWMDNYITLAPTEIAPLLPLSPPTVFTYVNGKATFAGFEAAATLMPTPHLTLSSGVAYLWGNDDKLDEPAIGVAPAKARFAARYSFAKGRYYAEGALTMVGSQDRVATLRGEQETDGYTLVDLRAHAEIVDGVSILAGVRNLADRFYVNHLNASNPFSGQRIAEPGRALFANINVTF